MVNYYYYSFNMSSLFKFFNKLFLMFSLMYTGYYTLKFQWIRNYMNFGICPELPDDKIRKKRKLYFLRI
jgi:hypothetical protein